MRYPILCAVFFLAGGCALPVPLQIASWAMSGVSYATTGKSISDHAVSAVAEQDCAVHRIALGKNMCNTAAPDEEILVAQQPPASDSEQATATPTNRLRNSMIALAETLEGDIQPASRKSERPETPKLDTALLAMADTLNSIERELPATAASKNGKHYLVIGRYRALGEAEKMRTRHAALGTKVRMILQNGTLYYQVTAGPFDRPGAEELEATFERTDQLVRVALLCADGVTPAPCGTDAPQLTALPGAQFTK